MIKQQEVGMEKKKMIGCVDVTHKVENHKNKNKQAAL